MTEVNENKQTVKSEEKEGLRERAGEFLKENALPFIAGFVLELGASKLTSAPSSTALAAGLPAGKAFTVLFGGVAGALLHGFPDGLIRLSGMAIVLAARLIPDARNIKLRAAIRAVAGACACFFPRSAEVMEPSELLFTIIAALAAGLFAACVCLLSDSAAVRGFDISEPSDCACAGVIIGLTFIALGSLDYPFVNIGRLAAGFLLLSVSARRGLAYCALFGISSLAGLSCSGADIGRGAAVIALAVVLSAVLTRYGKLTRAAGFVFFSCVGAVIGGIDEGSWSILVETSAAGVMFAALPIEKFRAESDFKDSTVAMMIRERLCFAADAIAGIGTGLAAAAETLDRKYGSTLEQAAERAADRICRACPNSMVCWGQHFERYRGEFERLMRVMREGGEVTALSLSPECAAECLDPSGVANAVRTEYARFISACADERRVKELRRVYSDQLGEVHDILRDMGCERPVTAGGRAAEKRIETALRVCGMEGARAFVTRSSSGRLRVEAYGDTEPRVEREYLGELFIAALGREMELPEISRSGERFRVTASERSLLSAEIGAYQLSKGKNRVCGDCYDSFTGADGALYIVLSDGMGTGSRARIDSAMACSVISRLLKGGFSLSAALETVNNVLMVKSADESFATLDICRIDLNSGDCTVYKAGAATTYIKSSDKLIRASLSSPPAGTGGKLTVPAQKFRVSAGDKIIMATDGAVIDEEWLSRELSSDRSPSELSERIARAARAMENGRDDDISVVAVSVGR